MPYRDGYCQPWPTGPDFESATPAMWVELDRDIGSRLTARVQSVDERDTLFPRVSLGVNDFVSCVIGPAGERHEWNGKKWLIYDREPRVYTGFVNNGVGGPSYWLGTGGSITSTYQRRGEWCDMQMYVVFGAGANSASEALTFYLSYEVLDMGQTGTASWRNPTTAGWNGAITMYGTHNFAIHEDGARWRASTHNAVEGTTLSMQMTYRMRVA